MRPNNFYQWENPSSVSEEHLDSLDHSFRFRIIAGETEPLSFTLKGYQSFDKTLKEFCNINNYRVNNYIFIVQNIKIEGSPQFLFLIGKIEYDQENEIKMIQIRHSDDDDVDDNDDDGEDAKYYDDGEDEVQSESESEIEINFRIFSPKNLRIFIKFLETKRVKLTPTNIKEITSQYKGNEIKDSKQRINLSIELTTFTDSDLNILKYNINNLENNKLFEWNTAKFAESEVVEEELFEDLMSISCDYVEDIYNKQSAAARLLELLSLTETIQSTAAKFINLLKKDGGSGGCVIWTNTENEMIKTSKNTQEAIFKIFANNLQKRSVSAILKQYSKLNGTDRQ